MIQRISTESVLHLEAHAWNRFKNRLRGRWDSLSEKELDRYEGRFDSLVKIIHERCSEPRDEVQNFIDNLWFEIYVRGSRWNKDFIDPLHS